MSEKVETVEVDENLAKSIADKVAEGVLPSLEKSIEEKIDSKFEAKKEELEKNISKNVTGGAAGADFAIVTEKAQSVEFKMVNALVKAKNGDNSPMIAFNKEMLEARTKAGYGNESVSADGGYLVPPPEFEAEVEKLLPLYGVASNLVTVRNITGNSVRSNLLSSNVSMYDTAEGAQKTGTKLVFDQKEVALRKFAAIAPLTDELNEDSAVDFYNELIEGFAQETAYWEDKLVFTENGTTAVTKGILRTAGTNVEPIASVAGITWDDIMNAESKVPTRAMANATWVMHRTLWNVIKQAKDNEGRYQLVPGAGLQTPWGSRIVLSDIMPPSTDADSDGSTPLAVFGDFKRIKLYRKRGLVIDILKEGTVHDADGNAINLAEKDMTAVRAVVRMVKMIKFPNAFTVLGTGNVS